MKVKIDTRERFHVITIDEASISANMTEKMDKVLLPLLENNVKNIVLNIKDIQKLDYAAAVQLIALQQRFYAEGASFVVCGLQSGVKQFLDGHDLLDQLNYTPTESEAMDIVQMEEIERDMDDTDDI